MSRGFRICATCRYPFPINWFQNGTAKEKGGIAYCCEQCAGANTGVAPKAKEMALRVGRPIHRRQHQKSHYTDHQDGLAPKTSEAFYRALQMVETEQVV